MDNESKKIAVLYHAHCADGFAAALVSWMVFRERAAYFPVQYGQPMPAEEMIRLGVEELYLLDFSYPRASMENLSAALQNVVVIDHHKTAQEALRGLHRAGLHITFDMARSGAILALEYFAAHFPGSQLYGARRLLEYVQDRDLWKWELPNSREVSAALQARPRTFEEWSGIVEKGGAGIAQLTCEGKYLLRAQAQMLEGILDRRRWTVVQGGPLVFCVPTINTPVLVSEACERLLDIEAAAKPEFVASYFDQATPHQTKGSAERVWSLRSRGEFDVSEIAKARGGGGHRNAAGFTEVLP